MPHYEEVTTLTEPQVWVLIGVFSAAMFGMLTISTNLVLRAVRSEIGSVRSEIGSLREVMDARFDAVNIRIDHLDRNVQALTRHVFGGDPTG